MTFAVDERIDDSSGTQVQIGSVQGRLRVTDSAYVERRPPGAPTLLVVVYALPDTTATALRVARSVVASTAATQVSIQLPWVPDRFTGHSVVSTLPVAGGRRQSLTHTSAGYRQSCTIVAQTAPAPASSTHHTTVRTA